MYSYIKVRAAINSCNEKTFNISKPDGKKTDVFKSVNT